MKYSKILLTICAVFVFFVSIHGNIDIEQKNVLETVNKFFEVLETGDVDVAKDILMDKGSNFSVREEEETFTIKFTQYKSLIESLPKTKGKYKEVITDPKFFIHHNIAVVWAKYKFYINGKFSHCGVDSFSLIKDKDKWKIASIIYTVEKKGCK